MTPLPVYWDGEVLVPFTRYKHMAAHCFTKGVTYPIVIHAERSRRSHDHYFATIHEAWLNLPETIAERWPTDEHLRKWALVHCGYCDERSLVLASAEAAHDVAAFIRPSDSYAVITVAGPVVRVFTAQSQSQRAMGQKVFQASKTQVLDMIAAVVGVEREILQKAGAAA